MIKLLLLCLLAILLTMVSNTESSTTVHVTTKKTTTKSNDKTPQTHPSESSTTAHTTTKKTTTKSNDKTPQTHPSESSTAAHTTTKKTTTKSNDKTPQTHPSESSTAAHTTTKKTTTKSNDKTPQTHPSESSTAAHTSTKKTTPQLVPLICKCNGGLKCQDNHCSIKAPKVYCVTTAEQNTLEKAKGQPRSALNRTCQENYGFCNTDITITLTEEVYWRSSTKCCNDSHNCNSASFKAPQPSTTTGNRVCPSCFALNATDCTPTNQNCVESETKCINITGTVNNGTSTSRFVGRGCASDSVMKIKNGSTLVFGTNTYHFKSITADASQTLGSVPFIFLLSSFLGLWQAKFFY